MSLAVYRTRQMILDAKDSDDGVWVYCPAWGCSEEVDVSSDEIDELLSTGSVLLRCLECDQAFYLDIVSEDDYKRFS